MANIVFKFLKDCLVVTTSRKDDSEKKLNNTNVINTKELKFSLEYIEQNKDLVSNFLNVIVIKNNITKVQINNMDYALITLDIIKDWDRINNIDFSCDKRIDYDVFMKLLDNQHVKTIECYEMPSFLVERLDLNRKIRVIVRHKIKFKSQFMKENVLNSYTDIYYRKHIIIKDDFDKIELEDFKYFMGINAHLKTIKLFKYSNNLLTVIIDELKKYNRANIKIIINEKSNDLDVIYTSITYIKKKEKKFLENNKITFKLNFSKEYRRNNFFKELNFTIFKYIIIGIICISTIMIGINYYIRYHDEQLINYQIDELNDLLNAAEQQHVEEQKPPEQVDVITPDDKTTTTTKKVVSSYYTNFEQVFSTLLEKNDNTVGWLKVNNTKINYPVVQAQDNDYYLKHDFYKYKNSMGWIYMDYRNNAEDLGKNTIIYGHNIKAGLMFGTLKYTLNSSWYQNSNNQIITFNTLNKNMRFKIFSIYVLPENNDYLKTSFDSDEEFLTFINKITERSIYNFNVEVDASSKILTLSTCNTSADRIVVHAVLID